MPAIHWLRCREGHVTPDVIVRDGILPACPGCGGATRVTWEHGQPTMSGVFKPLDLGGGVVATSRDDLAAKVAFLEQKHGCAVEVVPDSRQAMRVRTDELRHRAWTKEARAGGVALKRELATARERKGEEAASAAEKQGTDPSAARNAAAATVPSQAAASGRAR